MDDNVKRMRQLRARRRKAGYRPVELWLPEAAIPEFREQARKVRVIYASSVQSQEAAYRDLFDE